MEKQEVIKAAECGAAWVNEQRQRKRDEAFHELLESMCQKVIKNDAQELSFYVKQLVDDPTEAGSGKIKPRLFGNFGTKYATYMDSISEFANDRGYEFIPKVEIFKTGKANVGTFDAQPTPVVGFVSRDEIPAGAIRYTFDEKHQLRKLFGFISGMRLRAWPFAIVAFLVVMVGGVYALWLSALMSSLVMRPTFDMFVLLMATIFVGVILWRRYQAFDRFTNTKIALTHDALIHFTSPQSVVVQRLNEQGESFLEVISASATCPICQGEVRLRKPSFSCSHEVVGACRNNPSEHCFTFDHMTRLGWPITETARRHVRGYSE